MEVLYAFKSNVTQEEEAAQKSETAKPIPKAERTNWVKVPIRRGDSLQKLSLKYDLPVATIKSSNNIVGAEIG